MSRRVTRILTAVVLGGVAAWWARLLAHSKVPPPEGRWHEIRDEELG